MKLFEKHLNNTVHHYKLDLTNLKTQPMANGVRCIKEERQED